jgi:HK97 family phage major capsid protein
MASASSDLNGFPVVKSSAADATKLILGDFSQLLIGTWNTPEIAVNPFSQFDNGGLDVRIMTDIDSAVKHPEAFTVINNV